MKKQETFHGLIDLNDIQEINSETFVVNRSISLAELPFLADHIIYGECLFPASMMLEMMAECGQAIAPVRGSIIIEDFRILRPLKILEPRMLKLYAHIEPGGIEMSLCADHVKNTQTIRKDIVYARAVFKTASFCPDIDRDAFLDGNAHCFSLAVEDLYFKDFIQVGPEFQGLGRELCFSKTHFMGSISKTQSKREFLMEPFRIDNCLQLGGIANSILKGFEVIPVGIDSLCFFNKHKPSTQETYCYGVTAGYEDLVTIQNFILCDESETIILSASGVRQHVTERVKFDIMKHLQQAHARTIH
jgi:hypothetical protein